jgi:chloride channel protein, CIC family
MPGGDFNQFAFLRKIPQLLKHTNVRLTEAFYLNFIAAAIGLLVAVFAYVFKGTVYYFGDLIRGDSTGNQLPFFHEFPVLVYLIPPLGGLLVGAVFRRWGRHRQFHGISAVIESVARRGGKLDLKRNAVELLASALTLISGMSVGMEGPVVTGGSTIGANVSDVFHLSAARRRTLLAAGAAAGLSAVFNAPIAGFFFALELILGDFNKKAIAPIVLASVSANITMSALTGGEPLFTLPSYGLINSIEMVNYIILGILCGLVSYLFAELLLRLESLFARWRIYPPLKPAVGGALVSLTAVFFPEILGNGESTIQRLLNGHYPASQHLWPQLIWSAPLLYLLFLCLAKVLATSLTLGSGASGGKFMPALFMGAALGGVFGVAVNQLGWIQTEAPAAYALVGMAAIFGAIAQAPLAIILMVFEMTSNYTIILPMLATGVVSQVVFYSLRREGVFTHQLAKLGVKFGRGKDLNILEAIPVTRVMHAGVDTVALDEPLSEIRQRFQRTEHRGFPVLDGEGKLYGILTTSDLARQREDKLGLCAGNICTHPVHSVGEEDNCHTAIALLEDYNIGRVPVVGEDGRPVGIITRTDIVGAYKLALQERERELADEA